MDVRKHQVQQLVAVDTATGANWRQHHKQQRQHRRDTRTEIAPDRVEIAGVHASHGRGLLDTATLVGSEVSPGLPNVARA
jgi:hypothetical protein